MAKIGKNMRHRLALKHAGILPTEAAKRRAERQLRSVSGNNPCPCDSGKKFKRCCGLPKHEIVRVAAELRRESDELEVRLFQEHMQNNPGVVPGNGIKQAAERLGTSLSSDHAEEIRRRNRRGRADARATVALLTAVAMMSR